MAGLEGQELISTSDSGAIALSDKVNHVYGAVAEVIAEPPAQARMLVLIAEKGDWRVRVGSHAGAMPAAFAVAAAVADGSGAVALWERSSVVLPAPSAVTVRGYGTDSALTYYWL